jgi:hypothetical protein
LRSRVPAALQRVDRRPLEKFIAQQNEQLEATARLFKGAIQETLETVVGATMSEDVGGDRERERLNYERMVILTIHMLDTVLRHIVHSTVVEYSRVFSQFLTA